MIIFNAKMFMWVPNSKEAYNSHRMRKWAREQVASERSLILCSDQEFNIESPYKRLNIPEMYEERSLI